MLDPPLRSNSIWEVSTQTAVAWLNARYAEALSRPLVLLGAGNTGARVAQALLGARRSPACFADDTPGKAGQELRGIPIYSMEEAIERFGPELSVVVCIFNPGHAYSVTASRLRALGEGIHPLPFFTVLQAIAGPAASPYYFFCHPAAEAERMESYRRLYDALEDEASRAVLEANLSLRLLHAIDLQPTARSESPLPHEVLRRAGLTYVDAGAFDGDTLKVFLDDFSDTFGQAIAIEPDQSNARKLRAFREALGADVAKRVVVVDRVLWNQVGRIGFEPLGNMGSAVTDGPANSLECTCLDVLLADVRHPVHIKMDVEGAELQALAGATETTARVRPTWAVSAYHQPHDLVSIFDWFEAQGQKYRYGLRCHGGDGSDLVLYAW